MRIFVLVVFLLPIASKAVTSPETIRSATGCEFEISLETYKKFNYPKPSMKETLLLCDVKVRRRQNWDPRWEEATGELLVKVGECEQRFDWLEATGIAQFGIPRVYHLGDTAIQDADERQANPSNSLGDVYWNRTEEWRDARSRFSKSEISINRLSGSIRYKMTTGSFSRLKAVGNDDSEGELEVSGNCKKADGSKRRF